MDWWGEHEASQTFSGLLPGGHVNDIRVFTAWSGIAHQKFPQASTWKPQFSPTASLVTPCLGRLPFLSAQIIHNTTAFEKTIVSGAIYMCPPLRLLNASTDRNALCKARGCFPSSITRRPFLFNKPSSPSDASAVRKLLPVAGSSPSSLIVSSNTLCRHGNLARSSEN